MSASSRPSWSRGRRRRPPTASGCRTRPSSTTWRMRGPRSARRPRRSSGGCWRLGCPSPRARPFRTTGLALDELRDNSVEPRLVDTLPEGPLIGQDGGRERLPNPPLPLQEGVLPHDIPARIWLDTRLNASTVGEVLLDQVPPRNSGLELRMLVIECVLGSRQGVPCDLA